MRRALAGTGLAILALGLAPAENAGANSISSIVLDDKGRLVFSDYVRNRIWKSESPGRATAHIANKHTHHLALAPNGELYGEHATPEGDAASLWKRDTEGNLTEISPPARRGESVGYEGSVFTIDGGGAIHFVRECQIVRLAPQGRSAPWAGKNCGAEAWKDAALRYGHLHGSLAWGPGGVLYFSDARTIRRVSPAGSVSTLDGSPAMLFGEPRTGEPVFERLMGLALDPQGNIYTADRGDRSVRRIAPDGTTSLLARLPAFWTPVGLTYSRGAAYILAEPRLPSPRLTSGVVGSPRVLKLAPDGKLTTVAVARGR